MNIKSIIRTSLFSFLFLPFSLNFAVVTPPPAMQNLPEFQLSEDDLKAIAEFVEQLSPEELDALAEMGKTIVEEAEKAGVDPFAYAQYLDTMYAEEHMNKIAAEEKRPVIIEPKRPEKTVEDTRKITNIQEAIQDIIRSLQEFRQKASHNEEFANQLVSLKYRLDDIVYYLHALLHEKILAHLSKAEFDSLVAQLRSLQQTLAPLANRLEVPEFSLEGYDPYHVLNISHLASPAEIVQAFQKLLNTFEPKLIAQYQSGSFIPDKQDEMYQKFTDIMQAYAQLQSYEEARHVFDEIMRLLMNVTPQLLEDMKTVFKKYEPEIVKAQQEREKIEQDARKRQEEALRKMPLPGRYLSEFTMPRVPYYSKELSSYDYGATPSYYPPATPYVPSGIETRPTSAFPGEKKPGIAKDKKKEDRKKKKKSEKKETEKADKGEKKGLPGAPGKKAPADDVQQSINYAKYKFDQLKSIFKKEENKNLLKDILLYFTKPLALGDQHAVDIKKLKEILKIISDTTAIFTELTKIINDTLRKFKDDETKQKQFKDAIQEQFNAIESKAAEFVLLIPFLTFKGDAKINIERVDVPFSSDKLFALTGQEALLKKLSEGSRKDMININPVSEPVEVPDPTPEDPTKKKTILQSRNYIQKLQDAYKEAKDALKKTSTKTKKP